MLPFRAVMTTQNEEENKERQEIPPTYRASYSSGIYGSYTPNNCLYKITYYNTKRESLNDELHRRVQKYQKQNELMISLFHIRIHSLENEIKKSQYAFHQQSENKEEKLEKNQIVMIESTLHHKMDICTQLKSKFLSYEAKLNQYETRSMSGLHKLHDLMENQRFIYEKLMEMNTTIQQLTADGNEYNDMDNINNNESREYIQRLHHIMLELQHDIQRNLHRFYQNDDYIEELMRRILVEADNIERELDLASENQALHEELIKQMNKTDDIFKLAKQIYKQRGSPVIVDRNNVLNDIKQHGQKYRNVALPMTLAKDTPFNEWNEESFKQEFSNKFNIPIGHIQIISVRAGSQIIKMKIATDSVDKNGKHLKIECIADKISSTEAKKAFIEWKIFAMEFGKVDTTFTAKKQRVIMNPKWNKIYGPNNTYWRGALNDGKSRGGEPYHCPNGWERFSVQFSETPYDFKNVYDNWPIAYHGTKFDASLMISFSGFRASLGYPPYGLYGEGVYLSPSIEYCAQERYAKPIRLDLNSPKQKWSKKHPDLFQKYNGKRVQIVFACRVKPGSYQKKPETMGLGQYGKFDNIDKKEIEWVIPAKAGTIVGSDKILIYGYMIKVVTEAAEGCNVM